MRILACLTLGVVLSGVAFASDLPNSDVMKQIIKKNAKVVFYSLKDGQPMGEGSVLELARGTYFMLYVKGVSPSGSRGLHIDESTQCDKLIGHYNPDNAPHGDYKRDGEGKAHVGDLGNIVIQEDGSGEMHRLLPGVRLEGDQKNVFGKAIVLHEKEDSLTPPDGGAGEAIACGIIE